MLRGLCLGASLVAFALPVQAAIIKLRCNNNPHDFIATYDEEHRIFKEDDAVYTVLGVEKTRKSYTVFGSAYNDGPPPTPTFKAYIRPQRKIEYYQDGKLFQTDRCK